MQKALITYWEKLGLKKIQEVPLPIAVDLNEEQKRIISDSKIAFNNILSIDVAPEEEYFLVDFDKAKYCIPVKFKDRVQGLQNGYTDYMHRFRCIITFGAEFGQYREEGDWEKTYKIVKR